MFKLIVSDMDGTLLTDKKEITESTKQAIGKLNQHGAHFTIATGRIYPAAKMYSDDLGITTPMICCNGAVIIDPVSDEVLYGHVIDKETGIAVIDICEKYGVYYHLYDKDTIYSNVLERVIAYFREVSKNLPEKYQVKTKVVPDTRALFDETSIYKVGIHYDNTEKALEMRKELEALSGVSGFKSLDVMYDVMARGANKGTALTQLCESLDIPLSQVVAFGDNENDLEMLQTAGFGIAMENAEDFVKEVADHVTYPNESEGVRLAIEELFKMT